MQFQLQTFLMNHLTYLNNTHTTKNAGYSCVFKMRLQIQQNNFFLRGTYNCVFTMRLQVQPNNFFKGDLQLHLFQVSYSCIFKMRLQVQPNNFFKGDLQLRFLKTQLQAQQNNFLRGTIAAFLKNAAIANLQLHFKTQLKRKYTLAIAAFLKNAAIGPAKQFFKGNYSCVY